MEYLLGFFVGALFITYFCFHAIRIRITRKWAFPEKKAANLSLLISASLAVIIASITIGPDGIVLYVLCILLWWFIQRRRPRRDEGPAPQG